MNMLNEKKIWVILRGNVAHLPPIMSVLQALLGLPGYKVAFVSSVPSGLDIDECKYVEHILPARPSVGMFSKLIQYWLFRRFVIKTLSANAGPTDIVWFGSLDTVLALWGSSLFGSLKYILQLHELYDTHRRRLKLIMTIAQNAKVVVVPEINRAGILQVWLELKKRPVVIPNKPYKHPRQKHMKPSSLITKELLSKNHTEKPIVLYQGHISGDRNLMPLAEAMRLLPDMELWLMGQDHGFAEQLVAVSDNIKYLGYVPAPFHLEITSYASIGVMSYDPVNLNNLFCAPNKVWEYAGFGIPFISNDALSLMTISSLYKCGLSVNCAAEDIRDAIISIMSSYGEMEVNSCKYFASFEYDSLFKSILGSVR